MIEIKEMDRRAAVRETDVYEVEVVGKARTKRTFLSERLAVEYAERLKEAEKKLEVVITRISRRHFELYRG